MTQKFDVIIIGAGPAGLMAASKISSQSNLKTAVITDNKLWETQYDVKGTAYDDLKKFNLQDCIESVQSTFGMYSKKLKTVFDFKRKRTCVINFPKLLKILKTRAKNCRFIHAIIIDGCRTGKGIDLHDGKGNKYHGKLIIDASGNAFALAHALGLKIPKATYHCASAIFENCNFRNANEMSLYMDHEICNSALWIYPITKKKVQMGLGEISIGKTVSDKFLYLSLLRAAKQIKWFSKHLKNAKMIKKSLVFGHKPVIEPSENIYGDNYLLCGDSGGLGTALVGEGVRPALYSGSFAATVAIRAFRDKKFKAKSLRDYETMWWNKFGKHEMWYIILRHFVVKSFSGKDWDEIIKRLRTYDNDSFWRIISSEMDGKDLLDLFDIKITEDIIVSQFKHLFKKAQLLNKRRFVSEFT